MVGNTSAYSVDGLTQDMFPLDTTDNSTLIASASVATDGSGNWGWTQIPAGSSSDGTIITTGEDFFLGTYNSANAMRFVWKPSATDLEILPYMCQYGGQIKLEIEYPLAPDPRSRPALAFFVETESPPNSDLSLLSSICSTSTIPSSGRKLKLTANVWAGIEGRLHTACGFIVIYDAVGAVMPVGTKIKLTAFAGVPKNRQIYDKFWPNFEDYDDTKNSGFPSYITYAVHDTEYLTADFAYGLTIAKMNLPNLYNDTMYVRTVDETQG
jgi:hypothetical protein